jgi:hypothetical protein
VQVTLANMTAVESHPPRVQAGYRLFGGADYPPDEVNGLFVASAVWSDVEQEPDCGIETDLSGTCAFEYNSTVHTFDYVTVPELYEVFIQHSVSVPEVSVLACPGT